jgi:hypothetical protein
MNPDPSPPPTSSKLLVHGYIRMEEPDEAQITAMRMDLGAFCVSSDFRLGLVFIDRGVPGDAFARKGYIDLLDAIRDTEAHAVLVPTLDHLSTQEFVRDALIRMAERAGAKVIVVYEADGANSSVEGGRQIPAAPGAPS